MWAIREVILYLSGENNQIMKYSLIKSYYLTGINLIKRVPQAVSLVFIAFIFLISCERIDYKRVAKVDTGTVTEMNAYSAEIKGEILDVGDGGITHYGHCWSEKANPEIEHSNFTSFRNKLERGSFTSILSDLSPETKYYCRAYATGLAGTVYGNQIVFTTEPAPLDNKPVAQFTAELTTITEGEFVQFFDLSTNDPTEWYWDFGDGDISESQDPIHQYLEPGQYTVELTARNVFGADTEIKFNFITVDSASFAPIIDFTVSSTLVKAGQNVLFTDNSLNYPAGWMWNFGDGQTSTLQNPMHAYSSAGIFSVTLAASNSKGSNSTTINDLITVTENIVETGTFIDGRDGHEYKIVKIGEQWWMAENLAYLPFVNTLTDSSIMQSRCYVYDFAGTNVEVAKATENYRTYGVLYNWASAMNGSPGSDASPSGVQGACPEGWHLPSDAEWDQLIESIGSGDMAGGDLKETGFDHWENPNLGATNSTGFTALPGGYYGYSTGGFFYGKKTDGWWWTSSDESPESAIIWGLNYLEVYIITFGDDKYAGNSIRCVRN
jgi:uncharacterized protein (TIGR02145 family)